MKKMKECEHCEKKFRNRQSLHNHIKSFHLFSLKRDEEITAPVVKESKPLRRVRMAMHAAKRKKERDLVARKAHNHGVQRFH